MSWWTDRVDAGLCGQCGREPVQRGFARCTGCLTVIRDNYNIPEEHRTVLDYIKLHAAITPTPAEDRRNKIAHCGRWWPIEHFPWIAPCCGTVYELKE